jgi:hypothetical protein
MTFFILAFLMAGLITLEITAGIDIRKIEKIAKIIITNEVHKTLEENKLEIVQSFLKEDIFNQFVPAETSEHYYKTKNEDTLSEEDEKIIASGFIKYNNEVIKNTCHEIYLKTYHKIYKFYFSSSFELGFLMIVYHTFFRVEDFIDLENLNYMCSKLEVK